MAEHEMETAVDKVEALFRKADSNIEYLSRKLNNEFQQSFEGDGTEVSPLEMRRRLHEIKKEFSGLQSDTEEIKNRQEEMVTHFRTQLTAISQAIQGLQASTGVKLEDSRDQEAIIEGLLGIKLQASSIKNGTEEGHLQIEENGLSPTQTASPGAESAPSPDLSSPEASREEDISPQEMRLMSQDFYPVQEAEFMSVSEIVRGRAKLDDVNRTYRKLYDHFQGEPKSAPLTTKEMTSMGMRITGATGQAKLKVLRALKLVTITNKGDVKLV